MKLLLLGSGGREHALAWKLSQSQLVDVIFVCPGNAGTALLPKTTNLDSVTITDFPQLVAFATRENITLIIPGPEQPVVDGVESHFRKVGIPIFGPSVLAARMEGSKAFAKAFMARHSIPTAKFRTFTSAQVDSAIEYVKTCGHKVVLKASGLAAGKGVLIPETLEETIQGLRDILVVKIFGAAAGAEVVVEELLTGVEISVLAFSDGYTIVPLPAAQDHKRIGDGDVGKNTGGMGAYAPAPVATPAIMEQIMNETLRPTINGMRKDGFPFLGLLFTGFMLTETGPKVLEYNVRFGDPETQSLMLLLREDVDLADVFLACAQHRLDSVEINCRPGFAVSVVLASKGYPDAYTKGKRIEFKDLPSTFHAGTSNSGADIITSGGRVLAISAYAPTLEEALSAAYVGVDCVTFEGKTYRSDIGQKALKVEGKEAPPTLTYAQAGVSIDVGNSLVETIKPLVRSTRRTGADAEIGGFGGIFDLKAAGYKDPVLVSATDGVGTKLRIALEAGIHNFVGVDLVAMSVNDLLVQGAEPLYFLDYYSCGKLDIALATKVIDGIAEGCRQAGCALIGGETAEMPGMYAPGEYDLAGFAVGAAERGAILPSRDIALGDVLLGLASSGAHSNGFSLIRKVLSLAGLTCASVCPWDARTALGAALLVPTRIYVKQVLPVLRRGAIRAMAHITGGGIVENVPRVLPDGLGCVIDVSRWDVPPVFRFVMRRGVAAAEMARTFNMGIGMVLVVDRERVLETIESLKQTGEAEVHEIGKVVAGSGVELLNLNAWQDRA